jgi:hypothetical protein
MSEIQATETPTFASLSAKYSEKEAALKAAQVEVTKVQGQLDTVIASGKAELEKAESKVDALQTDCEDLKAEIAAVMGWAAPKARKNAKIAKVAKIAKTTVSTSGAGRGKKQCPKCSTYVGVRSAVCSNCNHEFVKGAKPATKPAVVEEDGGKGRRGEGEDLASMVVKALKGLKNGLNLPDLTEKVLKLGYKTQSQNLGQAIYNVLGKLKKEGKVAKDDEAKKYSLVGAA